MDNNSERLIQFYHNHRERIKELLNRMKQNNIGDFKNKIKGKETDKIINKETKNSRRSNKPNDYYNKKETSLELNNKEDKYILKTERTNKDKDNSSEFKKIMENKINIHKRLLNQINKNRIFKNEYNNISDTNNKNNKNYNSNSNDNKNELKTNLTNRTMKQSKKNISNLNKGILQKHIDTESFFDSNNNYNEDGSENEHKYYKKTSKEKKRNFEKNKTIDFYIEKDLIMNKLVNNQQLSNNKIYNLNNSIDNNIPINQSIIVGYTNNQAIYRTINNDQINSNYIVPKTIEQKKRIEKKILDYTSLKKKINKIKDESKDSIPYIKNERSFNKEINNNYFNILNPSNNERKINTIKIKSLNKEMNFHKNNSSSTLYCPHNNVALITSKNKKLEENKVISNNIIYNNDERKNFDINDRSFENNYEKRNFENNNRSFGNNYEKRKNVLLKNNKYIYQKAHRNESCRKRRVHGGNLGSELNKEITNFDNNSLNKSKKYESSFNSPVPAYNDFKFSKYINSVRNEKRTNSQCKNISRKNQEHVYEISELFNRENNDREKSSIQNLEDDNKSMKSTIKNAEKKYYYQLPGDDKDKNRNNKENILKHNKFFNLNNLSNSIYHKTIQTIQNNKKNIKQKIYDNNVYSFDYKNGNINKINKYEYETDDYMDNSSYYNTKRDKKSNDLVNDYINEKNYRLDYINEDESNKFQDSSSDFFNRSKSKNKRYNKIKNNNINLNYKTNNSIKTKKIIVNSIRKKKLANSFNYELKSEYKYNNKKKINENIPKSNQTFIINKKNRFNENNINDNEQNINYDDNNFNDTSSFIYKNKKINKSIKNSPKYNDKDDIYLKKIIKDNDNIYSNNKTIEDNFGEHNKNIYIKSNSRIKKLKGNSIDYSSKEENNYNNRTIYMKKNSHNNAIENNYIDFNRSYYPNKYETRTYYYKNNIKNKMSDLSATTENKTIKREQTDNYSINSSHNSNNNYKSISHRNNFEKNKNNDNNSISINGNDNVDLIILNDDPLYVVNEVIKNNQCFDKKFYYYNLKKPINKILYIEKYYKNKNKKDNKKLTNEINSFNNLSIISEIKNNDYNSSISFNNNKTKKNKEIPSEEIIFNGKKIIISDYEDSDNLEENENIENSNIKNKITDIKNNVNNDENHNDNINLKFLDEKNKNIDNNNYIKNFIEDENEKNQLKQSKKYLNGKELNNYLANSFSQIDKNELSNNKKEYEQKISLATKKLSDILIKKNENNNIIKNYNNDKINNKDKKKKTMREEEFVLGYMKLNDIFHKKSNTYKIKGKELSNLIINEKIDEEDINDLENDSIEKNKKFLTYKVKKNNKYLEKLGENINKTNEKPIKNDIENIASFKNNDMSLKDNLLSQEIKSHINELDEPEIKDGELNTNLLKGNNLCKLYKKLDDKNKSKIKEMKNEEKIKELLVILNKKNINSISEQLIYIIYYDNMNKSNENNILNKFKENINYFVNIIYDIISNEEIDKNPYVLLCNKLNSLIIKEGINTFNIENNLNIIFINEYIKRISNKKYFDYKNNKEFENIKIKFIELNNFILNLISSNLIKIEESFNIIFELYKEYENENKNDDIKYLLLQECIYFFESIFDIILKLPRIKDKIFNLIDNIENKFKKALNDKNIPNILKDKIISIIEKKKKEFGDEQDINLKTNNERIKEKEKNNYNNNLEKIYDNNKNKLDNRNNSNYDSIKNNNKKDNKKENKISDIKNDVSKNIDSNNEIDDKINNDKYEIKNDNKEIDENKNNEDININNNINVNESKEKEEINNDKIPIEYKNEQFNKNNIKPIPKNPNYELLSYPNNDIFEDKNENLDNIKKIHTVTHKKKSKSKKRVKSTDKRFHSKSVGKRGNIYNKKETEEEKYIKEEIKKDFENYLNFLDKKGIKTKEDIYDELNDSYNWNVIDDLIMKEEVQLEKIIKMYIDICKNKTKKDINENELFKGSEYIKNIIEYYSNNLTNNQKEILHLNMIELYMVIDDIIGNNNTNNDSDNINMYEILGDLLFILLKNKLYYMKDLNNFIEKDRETQINIAKVVKYTIIASGNCSKQYHNDFKYTKLFNNNEIFTIYVTNQLNELKIK